jgi:hypothetical protein
MLRSLYQKKVQVTDSKFDVLIFLSLNQLTAFRADSTIQMFYSF